MPVHPMHERSAIGSPYTAPTTGDISGELASIADLHSGIKANIGASISSILGGPEAALQGARVAGEGVVAARMGDVVTVFDGLRSLFSGHLDGNLSAIGDTLDRIRGIVEPGITGLPPGQPTGRMGVSDPTSSGPSSAIPPGGGASFSPVSSSRPISPSGGRVSCPVPQFGNPFAIPGGQTWFVGSPQIGAFGPPLNTWDDALFWPDIERGFYFSWNLNPTASWSMPVFTSDNDGMTTDFYFCLLMDLPDSEMLHIPTLDSLPIGYCTYLGRNRSMAKFLRDCGREYIEKYWPGVAIPAEARVAGAILANEPVQGVGQCYTDVQRLIVRQGEYGPGVPGSYPGFEGRSIPDGYQIPAEGRALDWTHIPTGPALAEEVNSWVKWTQSPFPDVFFRSEWTDPNWWAVIIRPRICTSDPTFTPNEPSIGGYDSKAYYLIAVSNSASGGLPGGSPPVVRPPDLGKPPGNGFSPATGSCPPPQIHVHCTQCGQPMNGKRTHRDDCENWLEWILGSDSDDQIAAMGDLVSPTVIGVLKSGRTVDLMRKVNGLVSQRGNG